MTVCVLGVRDLSMVTAMTMISLTMLLLSTGCMTFQQHACVSQGRICSDNRTCYHTERAVADQTCLTRSQYSYIGPTSPSTDPVTTGAWKGSH